MNKYWIILLSILISSLSCKTRNSSHSTPYKGQIKEETSFSLSATPDTFKVKKAIKRLNKALEHADGGRIVKFNQYIKYASLALSSKTKVKTFKAALMMRGVNILGNLYRIEAPVDNGELCFVGRYDSILKMVNKYKVYHEGNLRLEKAKAAGTKGKRQISIDYVNNSQKKNIIVNRCPKEKTSSIPFDSLEPSVFCGRWINDWDEYNECAMYEAAGCFSGNIRKMAELLAEEYLFGSDENWVENVRIIDNDTLKYDWVDGPNELRENDLVFKRCKESNPTVSTRLRDHSALTLRQLVAYLTKGGYIEDTSTVSDAMILEAIDEDLITTTPFIAKGKKYTSIIVYSGDTPHGPILEEGTTNIVGECSDGDYYLTINGRTVWLDKQRDGTYD